MRKLHEACAAGIVLVGLVLNILTLLALNKMKLNAESLFLMKCLGIYDSCLLLSWTFIGIVPYFAWILGFGMLSTTVYAYVYLAAYCFFRTVGPMAWWIVCVLTVQRYVARLSLLSSYSSECGSLLCLVQHEWHQGRES